MNFHRWSINVWFECIKCIGKVRDRVGVRDGRVSGGGDGCRGEGYSFLEEVATAGGCV